MVHGDSVAKLLNKIVDRALTSTHNFPIVTTGQLALHSCRQFLGLHLSGFTTASLYVFRVDIDTRMTEILLVLCQYGVDIVIIQPSLS